jgi:hypothetical protein
LRWLGLPQFLQSARHFVLGALCKLHRQLRLRAQRDMALLAQALQLKLRQPVVTDVSLLNTS